MGALGLGRVLQRVLDRTLRSGPMTLIAITPLSSVVAIAAAAAPARRAARLDRAAAFRAE